MQSPKCLMRCLASCLLGHVLLASLSFAEITQRDFPVVAPASLYVGDVPEYMEQVWLYLLDENYFVLKKTRSVSGKSKGIGQQYTGKWRQIDGGSNLQLTNSFGFTQVLNIGSSGKLYGSMQVGGAISTRTLTMSKIPYSKPQFKISGVLESRGSRWVLTDSAAGHIFPRVEGELEANSFKSPVFIEAEVSLVKNGIKIEKIYSSTDKLPSSLRMQKENWGDIVNNDTWQNDPGSGLQTASCRFRRVGITDGILEISGQGLHLELPYRVEEQRLQFPEGYTNPQNMTTEARRWIEMLSGHVVWQYEGTTLVLHSHTGRTLQLNKARR